MSGTPSPQWVCPQCGYSPPANDDLPPNVFFRPWHVRGRAAVKAYVESLGAEAREWLLALFVDEHLQLLAVDTIARGGVSDCRANFRKILARGYSLCAAGFLLVHNHPSGNPNPSEADVKITVKLSNLSRDAELPMLDHFIVAGDEMKSVGLW